MNTTSDILQNALAGADAFVSIACARSGEYLAKQSLDAGRASAQSLTLRKLSYPLGRTLNLRTHFNIITRIDLWLQHEPSFIRVRLDTHKTDFKHTGCSISVAWGTKWFPVWPIILGGLRLRADRGERLSGNSPVFG